MKKNWIFKVRITCLEKYYILKLALLSDVT
jgi:hypothetical protein